MLITILIVALIVSSWDNWDPVKNSETGGCSTIETQEFSAKRESKKIVLKEFKKVPKLVEESAPKPALLWSHSAVAIDISSGKILFGKDEKGKRPIASLTKIMTAIIIEENTQDWNEEIVISKKAAFSGGAGIHLKWDETITADNLFKAMLMNSDNSAAIALAEHIAGSVDEFANLMNKKTKELGAMNTYFKEPSGLEDEESYSCAHDLAKITQYAISKKKITKTMQIKGPIQAKSCNGMLEHRVGNTNLFLKDEKIASRIIGGKTGFTYESGYCLMVAINGKNKQEKVIGVILNSGKEMRWEEMKQMFDWIFNNYEWED